MIMKMIMQHRKKYELCCCKGLPLTKFNKNVNNGYTYIIYLNNK